MLACLSLGRDARGPELAGRAALGQVRARVPTGYLWALGRFGHASLTIDRGLPLETCDTLHANGAWGYTADHTPKPLDALVRMLVRPRVLKSRLGVGRVACGWVAQLVRRGSRSSGARCRQLRAHSPARLGRCPWCWERIVRVGWARLGWGGEAGLGWLEALSR